MAPASMPASGRGWLHCCTGRVLPGALHMGVVLKPTEQNFVAPRFSKKNIAQGSRQDTFREKLLYVEEPPYL